MVIHTFLFRWKSDVAEDQKQRAIDEIKALQGPIPGLLEVYVGHNFSPRSQGFEFAGVMKFADAETFGGYNDHPVHQKLLSWLVPLVEAVEVDFKI